MMKISLIPVTEKDKSFLFNLFIASRPDLEWVVGIDEETKMKLISQQFYIHEQMYVEYPTAQFNIIMLNGKKIGRLYVEKGKNVFNILSIAILPQYRSRGIGSIVIKELLEEAAKLGCTVQLRVAWFNSQARSLYERLGFKVIEDAGVYCEMKWANDLGK